MMRLQLTACIVVGVATTARAAPVNDRCEDAISILGTGVFAFDNQGATSDGPESCDGLDSNDAIGHDVWFCWTSDRKSDVTIDTCAQTTVDTKIAVYRECECPDFLPLEACNDDACVPFIHPCPAGACGVQSLLSFQVYEGESFLIRIGTSPSIDAEPGGGQGTFSIEYGLPADLPCAEPLSHCQPSDEWDALVSGSEDLVVADDFSPAESGFLTGLCWSGGYFDGAADCHIGSDDAFEVRYYLADGHQPGSLIAGPFRSENFSLQMAPRAKSGRRLLEVTPEFEYSATHEPVPVLAGETYWLEIRNVLSGDCAWYWSLGRGGNHRSVQSGRLEASGKGPGAAEHVGVDLAFCLSLPRGPFPTPILAAAHDECANSMALSEGATLFETVGATNSEPQPYPCFPPEPWCVDFPLGDEEIHRDLWFDYTPSCSATLTVGLCDSTFDTKLAIYTGAGCPPKTGLLASNDDACARPGYPTPQLASGQTAHDAASTLGDSTPDPSDCYVPHLGAGCDDPECEALVCAVDPYCCSSSWYNTCAAQAISFCRDSVGDGLQSQVQVRVTRDASYKIRLGGYRGASGFGSIELSLGPSVPTAATLPEDYGEFLNCLTGPCPVGFICLTPDPRGPCCRFQNYDADGDTDLRDFALFASTIEAP